MQPSLICAACRRAASSTAMRLLLARPLRTTTTTIPRGVPRRATTLLLPLRPRFYSSATPPSPAETPSMNDAEAAIARLLVDALAPSALLVQDVSGGCGSMYAIDIAAEAFRGQTVLRQQRMVNAALGDVVRTWHGVQIRTSVPEKADE